MWDGFELAGARRHELRGFGETPLPPAGRFSHADDLAGALGAPATLVGASFGGQVCLEVASRRPELVTRLVLLDAALPDHDWSDEILRYAEREEELLEQGELSAAAAWNADFWLEDPAHRERVIAMQERAFQLQSESEAEEVETDSIELSAVAASTLVVVGELDKADFHRIAERLAREIPDAESAVIGGAGHLPALERPLETAKFVQDFLGRP
ncbi:MAG: alpha/beta fold hydrolase [Thermoleophilaceae bacterium]